MSVHYTEGFKKEVVKAYMAGDKSTPQLAVEFNVAKSSVSKWVNEYKEECLYTTSTSSESNEAKKIDQWYIDLSTIIKNIWFKMAVQ